MKRLPLISLYALGILAAGCAQPAKPEDDGPPKRAVVSFQGRIVPAFVGTWAAKSGTSTMNLEKDGSVTISLTARGSNSTPSGGIHGSWLVDGKNLMLKYASKNSPEVAIKYTAEVTGNKMTLSSGGGHLKTLYERK